MIVRGLLQPQQRPAEETNSNKATRQRSIKLYYVVPSRRAAHENRISSRDTPDRDKGPRCIPRFTFAVLAFLSTRFLRVYFTNFFTPTKARSCSLLDRLLYLPADVLSYCSESFSRRKGIGIPFADSEAACFQIARRLISVMNRSLVTGVLELLRICY